MVDNLVIMNKEGWPGIFHARDLLAGGVSPGDVVEEAIKLTESHKDVRSVGYNSLPNAAGVIQLDASFMDGDSLQAGAVLAIEDFMHPISIARQVSHRTPHVMLAGDGAKRFARECGFNEETLLSPEAQREYQAWKEARPSDRLLDYFNSESGIGSRGTVICLVKNSAGSIAGGVSTSGWDYKYPGRIGDSPIIGAGLYVDSRYGAVACTHTGENTIRTSLARSVLLYMKKGASVQDSVAEGISDLTALRGGYQGQVVVYAFSKDGEFFVGKRFGPGETSEHSPSFYVWHDGMTEPQQAAASSIS